MIKKNFIFVAMIVFVVLLSIFLNFGIKILTTTKLEDTDKLRTKYEQYLKEYQKLNEYVANRDKYEKQLDEINSGLTQENILIYSE